MVRNPESRPPGPRLLSWAAVGLLAAAALPAQQGSVAGTLHNLSVSGPGQIRALEETEICKFCHIPHSAVAPVPLWGHALSEVRYYEVPEIRTRRGGRQLAPQPDGSSRLCLSCHDGTVALGEIAGEPGSVPMAGAQRLKPGQPGYIGTNLSGSHPISFVYPERDPGEFTTGIDMGFRPRVAIQGDNRVQLDSDGKMQCTTCHDPHADRFYQPGKVPHFWVKPTVAEVCLTCHELR
ncbi:MAG: cytochrome c3 family protein [bacterium]|nr:cytochrome c3 family protein [bacterium]